MLIRALIAVLALASVAAADSPLCPMGKDLWRLDDNFDTWECRPSPTQEPEHVRLYMNGCPEGMIQVALPSTGLRPILQTSGLVACRIEVVE